MSDAVAPSDPPLPAEVKRASSAAGGATKKRRMRRPNRIVTPQHQEQMAAMKANGLTDRAIGRAISLSPTSVRDHLAKPEVQATVEKHRAMFRMYASEQAAGIVHKAFTRVSEALDEGDPKAFDAYTRGISALERTSASASGENKPGQVNVAVGVGIQMAPEERDELLAAFRRTVIEEQR